MLPEDVTSRELPQDVRSELRTLSADNAEIVGRHLVMARRHIEDEPELAYRHAAEAARHAGRVAVVREAAGIAAYAAQEYAVALAELRAARRMSGASQHLPVMADCERGLGRPERALALAGSDEAQQLDRAGQVEMRIVAAGARQDLGQPEAAVVTLQISELSARGDAPWAARLRYAYADALLAAGRSDEALEWFARAAEADTEGETDASERVAELQGVAFVDLEEEQPEEEQPEEEQPEVDAGARGVVEDPGAQGALEDRAQGVVENDGAVEDAREEEGAGVDEGDSADDAQAEVQDVDPAADSGAGGAAPSAWFSEPPQPVVDRDDVPEGSRSEPPSPPSVRFSDGAPGSSFSSSESGDSEDPDATS